MTAAEFKTAMPQFEETDDSDVERIIARSEAYFDETAWGDLLDDGRNNWIAYELVREQALRVTPSALMTSGGAIEKIDEKIRLAKAQADWALAMSALGKGYQDRYLELRAIAGMGAVAV